MSKREQEGREREKREHEKQEHEEHEHERRGRPHGTGYGRERAVYLEYLARRWQGSAPPTPQAYARALKQWRQLPGSVVTAPADLGTIPDGPPVDDSSQSPQMSPNGMRDKERQP